MQYIWEIGLQTTEMGLCLGWAWPRLGKVSLARGGPELGLR